MKRKTKKKQSKEQQVQYMRVARVKARMTISRPRRPAKKRRVMHDAIGTGG